MKTLSIICLSICLVCTTGCASKNENNNGNGKAYGNKPTNVQKATNKTNKELDEADRVIGTTERSVNTVEKTESLLDRIGGMFD